MGKAMKPAKAMDSRISRLEDKVKNLSPKEQDFVHRYLETGKVKESGLLAGFSESSSDSYCSGLLKKPAIQEYILEVKKNKAIKQGWTPDKVIAKLDEVYTKSMQDKSYTASLNALKLLGQSIGMFQQEKEVKHKHELKVENLLKTLEKKTIKQIN